MLKQYREIKDQYKNEILFFRLGDFYEMFDDDALQASKILNITLTARNKGTENEMPMCGIPYHAAENYIAKLTRAGKRVAICEQLSDPILPGIVKREVIRVITPGTTIDDKVLDNKTNNFLVALVLQKNTWGLSLVDLTTGEFQATEINDFEILKNEINRWHPGEVIVNGELFNDARYQDYITHLNNVFVFKLPNFETPEKIILNHFQVKNFVGFGLVDQPNAIQSAGFLLGYLKETQKTALEHINKLSRLALENYMVLDQATIKNLDLFINSWTFKVEGSLLSVLDQTITAMGGRTLRKWLMLPLINAKQINDRLEAVTTLKNDGWLMSELIEQFKLMGDFERLVGKIGCNRANARDVVALKNSLMTIDPIKKLLQNQTAKILKNQFENLPPHQSLITLINEVLVDEPPAILNEGGMIKSGYNEQLDDLRQVAGGGKDWIRMFQSQEIERTGINSLKVKFNKVFGYYIEISNSNLSAVPDDYIRKQTLVNAERYITPELKEYEEKVLGAEEKIARLEYQIFLELREKIIKYLTEIQLTARLIGELDVLLSFAQIAKMNNYVCPQISVEGKIDIRQGRHPVIEKYVDRYVANDTLLDHEKNEIILLTGPNMSGKSSYIRQVALIVLMAQLGSFVPAEKAGIGVVDRIFTRVGASDNLTQGVSTFMNEMQEAANILNNATSNSLIILDEIGRGTATFDGVSIAQAIVEYLHDKIKAKTIFATHYHELMGLAENLDQVVNYCVAVVEEQGKIVFLHQIIKGMASDSYGIEVAKLAGLPESLILRAKQILDELEQKADYQVVGRPKQTALNFTPKQSKVMSELQKIDPDNLTPLQALQKIIDLKAESDD